MKKTDGKTSGMFISPYLTFNGNCQEAMLFYQSCFGGALHFDYLADSPFGCVMPLQMKNLVLQAKLQNHWMALGGSDLGSTENLLHSGRVALYIQESSIYKSQRLFQDLAVGGRIISPIDMYLTRGGMAALIDKYGIQWIFGFESLE